MLDKYKRIHFIGICGAGMSALAYVLVKKGFQVTGSDLGYGHMAREMMDAGVKIHIGQKAENIENVDAVVMSTAIHRDNPELMAARFKNIPVLHRSDVLAALLNAEGVKGVAVAGAHGKTTTSAMAAVIGAESGIDPTIVIGGEVASLHGNSRYGRSPYVIAEADESDGSFLKFHPYIPIITNIEDDHLDHYGTEGNIYKAFAQYLDNMKEGGTAVLCMDSPKVRRLAAETKKPFVTYGLTEDCDYYARDVRFSTEGTFYDVYHDGKKLASIHLHVPGRHNVLNSLGAFTASLLLGIPAEKIAAALEGFGGAKRRFETKGRVDGIWVVDDYAHHPTEIAVSLKAARQTGAERVICVFQPHRYTRTKILHDEFCGCFKDCDELLLTHIYPAGEDPIPGVTSQALAKDITATTGQPVTCIDGYDDVLVALERHARPGDLIITMGAGDVYKIGEELVRKLKEVE